MTDLIFVFYPANLVLLILSCILIIILPRKYALIPFIFTAIFIHTQERLVFHAINITATHLLLFSVALRIGIKREYLNFRLNNLDILVLCWQMFSLIAFTLLWKTAIAFQNVSIIAFETTLTYFAFRLLIDKKDYIKPIFISLGALSIAIGSLIALNHLNLLNNKFDYFTEVRKSISNGNQNAINTFDPKLQINGLTAENILIRFHDIAITNEGFVREGRQRVFGPFSNPNTLGIFFASIIPFFILPFGHSNDKYDRAIAFFGMICAIYVIYTTISSSALGGMFFGLMLMSLWCFRRYVTYLRNSFFILLAVLQVYWILFKSKSIFALLLKFNLFSESSGYHRYYLLDQFVKHIHEWWIFGVKSSGHWGPLKYRTFDQFSHYVYIGANGGVFTLLIFVSILILAFKTIGINLDLFQTNKKKSIIIWTLGVSLSIHTLAFFSVPYVDQVMVGFLALLAIISTTADLNIQISQTLFARLQKPPFGSAQGSP